MIIFGFLPFRQARTNSNFDLGYMIKTWQYIAVMFNIIERYIVACINKNITNKNLLFMCIFSSSDNGIF